MLFSVPLIRSVVINSYENVISEKMSLFLKKPEHFLPKDNKNYLITFYFCPGFSRF